MRWSVSLFLGSYYRPQEAQPRPASPSPRSASSTCSRRSSAAQLFVFLSASLSRLARIEPEEDVHVALVLLQGLDPEVKVGLPDIGDGVHPPRRTTLGRIPGALHRAVLLHVPQGPIHRAGVHRLKPELRHPLHHLVPVRVPLSEQHQDHRLCPVSRTSLGLVGLGSLVLGILPAASSLVGHVTPLRLQRHACKGCPTPPRVARRAPLGASLRAGVSGSPVPSRLSPFPRRTARKLDRPSPPPIGGRVWIGRRLRRRSGSPRNCRRVPNQRLRDPALSLPNSPAAPFPGLLRCRQPLSATIRYYHYTKPQKSQAAKGPEPSEARAPALKPLGRSFLPLTANAPGRTYDSASVAPKASKKKGRSPSSSLALRLVDARRTPAENVRCPASTTDRRDNCLLLTQDAGFLEGSKKPERSEASRPPLCSDPLLGKDLRTTFVELLYVLDAP